MDAIAEWMCEPPEGVSALGRGGRARVPPRHRLPATTTAVRPTDHKPNAEYYLHAHELILTSHTTLIATVRPSLALVLLPQVPVAVELIPPLIDDFASSTHAERIRPDSNLKGDPKAKTDVSVSDDDDHGCSQRCQTAAHLARDPLPTRLQRAQTGYFGDPSNMLRVNVPKAADVCDRHLVSCQVCKIGEGEADDQLRPRALTGRVH